MPNIEPILKWTTDLDLIYDNENHGKKISVEGNNIHWFLSLAVRNMFACHYSNLEYKNGYFEANKYSANLIALGMNKMNYLAANIGFIVSDRTIASDKTHRRKFIHWPLGNLDDFKWEKIVEESKKNRRPFKRPHTEDTLFYYLETDEVISKIITRLKNEGIGAYYKIYALVLDLHSIQYMCRECQEETIDIQSGNKGKFLGLLSEKLKNEQYNLPKKHHGLRMLTRFSADTVYAGDSTGEGKQAYNTFKTSNYLLKSDKEDPENDIQKLVDRKNCIVHRHDHEDLLRKFGEFDKEITTEELPKAIFISGSPGKVELLPSYINPLSSVSLASLWFKPAPPIAQTASPFDNIKRQHEDEGEISSLEERPTKQLKQP